MEREKQGEREICRERGRERERLLTFNGLLIYKKNEKKKNINFSI